MPSRQPYWVLNANRACEIEVLKRLEKATLIQSPIFGVHYIVLWALVPRIIWRKQSHCTSRCSCFGVLYAFLHQLRLLPVSNCDSRLQRCCECVREMCVTNNITGMFIHHCVVIFLFSGVRDLCCLHWQIEYRS